MPSWNKVQLIGNLTRDPQVKQLPTTTVAEFGLATSRRFKASDGEQREEVCFVDCSAFGNQAETIAQYCTKGKSLFVEGRLKFESWDDRSGGKRSKLTVVVENFQFLSPRDADAAPARDADEPPGSTEVVRTPKAPAARGQQKGKQKFNSADVPF